MSVFLINFYWYMYFSFFFFFLFFVRIVYISRPCLMVKYYSGCYTQKLQFFFLYFTTKKNNKLNITSVNTTIIIWVRSTVLYMVLNTFFVKLTKFPIKQKKWKAQEKYLKNNLAWHIYKFYKRTSVTILFYYFFDNKF